jgi:hypothetical protein
MSICDHLGPDVVPEILAFLDFKVTSTDYEFLKSCMEGRMETPIGKSLTAPLLRDSVRSILQTLGTQETERTMPYIAVLAFTLLLVAGSVVFVMTPPRRR